LVSKVLTSSDPAAKTNMFCEEIVYGRLAIMAILAYMAFGETSQGQSPGTVDATGDFVSKVLTSSGPAAKTNKFCEEIANSRLVKSDQGV
jgi:hypothetical protein